MAMLLTKVLKREVRTSRGPRTVDVTPHGVRIREKGSHHAYDVPWEAIEDVGAKIAAREARKEQS